MIAAEGSFPYGDTEAARLLLQGIQKQKAEGTSLRTLAKRLGYAQATVLSHMSKGRVPIPIERAMEIAQVVGIEPALFGKAVVFQRAPEMARHLSATGMQHGLIRSMELIAGTTLNDLTDEQKRVLKEVVADPHPERRWLSVAELPLVTVLRRDVPDFASGRLDHADLNAISALLAPT